MKVRKDEEYEFGSYRLNINECKLWRGNEEIKLRPKLFSLLLMFLEHQGQMLEKEELIRALWPDSIVEDSNLNTALDAALRFAQNVDIVTGRASKLSCRRARCTAAST